MVLDIATTRTRATPQQVHTLRLTCREKQRPRILPGDPRPNTLLDIRVAIHPPDSINIDAPSLLLYLFHLFILKFYVQVHAQQVYNAYTIDLPPRSRTNHLQAQLRRLSLREPLIRALHFFSTETEE